MNLEYSIDCSTCEMINPNIFFFSASSILNSVHNNVYHNALSLMEQNHKKWKYCTDKYMVN
jgi:hypothetical protein